MAFQMLVGFNERQKRLLEVAWIAGTRGTRWITVKKASTIDIPKVCKEIMRYINKETPDPANRFLLRLSSIFTNGVIRIHLKRVNNLKDDTFYVMIHGYETVKTVCDEMIPTYFANICRLPKRPNKRKRIIKAVAKEEKENPVTTMLEDGGSIGLNRVIDQVRSKVTFDMDITFFPELQQEMERRSNALPTVTDLSPVASIGTISFRFGSMEIEEVPMVIEEVPMVIEEVPMAVSSSSSEASVPMRRQEGRGEEPPAKKSKTVGRKMPGENVRRLPPSMYIQEPVKVTINRCRELYSGDDFKGFTGASNVIDNDIFELLGISPPERASVEQETTIRGTKRRTIEQINVPEQLSPEIIPPNEMPAIVADVPAALSDAPSELGSCPLDFTCVSLASIESQPRSPTDFPCDSSASSGSQTNCVIQSIIQKMSEWNLDDQPMTVYHLCDEPYTRLKMCRIFANLLVLAKEQRVILKTDGNSLDLTAIFKGPKFYPGAIYVM